MINTVPSSGNYTFFSSAFRASFENVRARNATRCVARRSIENSRSINTYSRSNNLRVIALLSEYRIHSRSISWEQIIEYNIAIHLKYAGPNSL